jgi:hypothetical protein
MAAFKVTTEVASVSIRDVSAMPPKSENRSSGSTREDAKRTLDQVLRRYGIQPYDRVGTAQRQEWPLVASPVHSEAVTAEAVISNEPFSPARQRRLGAPFDLQKPGNPKQSATAEVLRENESAHGPASHNVSWDMPLDEQPTRHLQFHFLVRLLECALTLHCQVTAQTAIDARDQVERIPNLIEWREVSKKELAEIQARDSRKLAGIQAR